MKAETWVRVSALFERALDLPPEERERLLSQPPGDLQEDWEVVRAEVERLLRLDGVDGRTLEPASVLRSASWTPGPGARVGRCTIVRTIASGGMGTVFEARQDGLRRPVALKTLRLGLVSPERLQRFRFEVEALSRLQHPGIAQVHEAGVHREGDAELPYFAMELVEGARDLLTHAREERLSQRERIELFLAVCEAVQHGHQRGVVHRDLKPSNVLVGAAGQPKVIDFGVARVTGEGRALVGTLTLPGEIVGTLRYMSPEQLAGRTAEVDTRSDTYALGCILHELSTGRPPYALDGLPLAEAARRLAETEPARPRDLAPELGWICLKCLAREPERRYASVAELAADLRRFLRGEPVLAGHPGRGYQLRKLVRRHRLALGAAVAVVAALVLGFVRARAEARAATREAEKARAISAFLERTLTSSGLLERGPEVRVVDVLEQTTPAIEAELAGMPEAKAVVDYVVGTSLLGLWRLDEAGRHLDAAWDYAVANLPPSDPLRIATLANRTRLLLIRGQWAAGEPLIREAEALALEHLGELDDTTLLIQGTLAELLLTVGQLEEADNRYAALLPRLIERYGPEHGEVIATLGGHALVWREQGRIEEARAEHERVLELAYDLFPPGHFRITNALANLAVTLLYQGKPEEAELVAREFVEQAESSLGSGHRLLWLAYALVARTLRAQGRGAEAVPFFTEALELLDRDGDEQPYVSQLRLELARIHLALGDRSSAAPLLRAALEREDLPVDLVAEARALLERATD